MKSDPINNAMDKIFGTLPGAYLILDPSPQFIILEANDAYLRLTLTTRDILGQPLFKVFPDNPSDPYATGEKNLTASLNHVISTRTKHLMPDQRFDTRIPGTNRFRMRYWRPANTPVLDNKGKLLCIIHSVEDVTDIVLLRKHLDQHHNYTELKVSNAIASTRHNERMNISSELHDNINQVLSTSTMYFGKALEQQPSGNELLAKGYELVLQAIQQIRALSSDIVSSMHDENNLGRIVNDLLTQVDSLGIVQVIQKIRLPAEPIVNTKIVTTIFRIIQEAITNVLKHAAANTIWVTLVEEDHYIRLTITDDGAGFDTTCAKEGVGLQNMKVRAATIDAALEIKSTPGMGCTIALQVPIRSR